MFAWGRGEGGWGRDKEALQQNWKLCDLFEYP